MIKITILCFQKYFVLGFQARNGESGQNGTLKDNYISKIMLDDIILHVSLLNTVGACF